MDGIISLLIEARDQGITVSSDGQKVLVRVSADSSKKTETFSLLQRHKQDVLTVLNSLPERLRAGQAWLTTAHQALLGGGSKKAIEIFSKNLDLWDNLDSLIIPRTCPIGSGGCDTNSPVICRSCGETNGKKNHH